MREDVRFAALVAADVERCRVGWGGGGEVGEADVDEEAGRGETRGVDLREAEGEVGFLRGEERGCVVYFVVGHCQGGLVGGVALWGG